MAMMRWLVDEPMPSRSRKPSAAVRYRSEGTANAIMETVNLAYVKEEIIIL
ncbi:hypothetical protein [Nonomuraea sp. NPDC050202]|uniref:hypothetical protein n=1 Tax=Nonomuraea sp. NPDC050202 TaxID=3155035 RepID=UPI0033DA1CAB